MLQLILSELLSTRQLRNTGRVNGLPSRIAKLTQLGTGAYGPPLYASCHDYLVTWLTNSMSASGNGAVQHDQGEGSQLIVTSHYIYGHRTSEHLSTAVSDLKLSSIDSINGVNIGEFARSPHDTPSLTYGLLNISSCDCATVAALQHDVVRNIGKFGRNRPDDGVVIRVTS